MEQRSIDELLSELLHAAHTGAAAIEFGLVSNALTSTLRNEQPRWPCQLLNAIDGSTPVPISGLATKRRSVLQGKRSIPRVVNPQDL